MTLDRIVVRPIGLYLLLTLVFSAPFYALIIATGHVGGPKGAYSIGLMWCPGLAALLACRLCGLPLSALGWRWGDGRWQVLAYLLPLTYVAIAYSLVWALGFGTAPDPLWVAFARRALGWVGAPDGLVIVGQIVLVASTGMVAHMSHALGEEMGWRGFLAPQMNTAFGFAGGAVLTGGIWTAWHLPLLLLADYNGGTPWWFSLSCFTGTVVGMSVIMAWLRLRSGSLWPPVVLHASHNLFIQSLFTPATAARGPITRFAIDEFGFAVPATIVVLAIAVWGWWRKRRYTS